MICGFVSTPAFNPVHTTSFQSLTSDSKPFKNENADHALPVSTIIWKYTVLFSISKIFWSFARIAAAVYFVNPF